MDEVQTDVASAQEHATPEMPESFNSPSEAARVLSALAHAKRKEAAQSPTQDTQVEEPAPEPGEQPAGSEEATEQEQPEVEAEQLPPIDPPVSWPKEDKEFFATLPRQAQERIAQREMEQERQFSRRQNETAEQRKANDAERQKTEQLRQQYEAQLPLVVQAIQQAIGAEFSDVKTMEDVQRLAREDWPRYVQWDAKQKQLAQWQTEAQNAQQRQQQEVSDKLQTWVKAQDDDVEQSLSKVPASERQTLANEAKSALIDYGFTEEQIVQLWNNSILRSAPLQRMMADAARYRIAKRTASTPAAKPVPPVQKPGNAIRAPNRALDSQIAALEAKQSLSLKEASLLVDLQAQKRKSAA